MNKFSQPNLIYVFGRACGEGEGKENGLSCDLSIHTHKYLGCRKMDQKHNYDKSKYFGRHFVLL